MALGDDLAAELGVRVFTVGVGTPQGRPVPLINDQGEVETDAGPTPYLVMEYLQGADLVSPPPGLDCLDTMLKVADGLEAQTSPHW